MCVDKGWADVLQIQKFHKSDIFASELNVPLAAMDGVDGRDAECVDMGDRSILPSVVNSVGGKVKAYDTSSSVIQPCKILDIKAVTRSSYLDILYLLYDLIWITTSNVKPLQSYIL